MADFSQEYTAAGAGWENLLTIMQGLGYVSGAQLVFLTIREDAGNTIRVKTGHSSASVAPVSATDGKPLSGESETFWGTDAGKCWIRFAGAHTVAISAHSEIDF